MSYDNINTMKIGYARVSTEDQSFLSQLDALREFGCKDENIYKEKTSGAGARDALQCAMSYLREGDTLVVTKLDRLGRQLKGLIELMDELKDRGIHFISLDDGINTSSVYGRFFSQIVGSFSELELNLIRERTQKGLRAARRRGRLGGRPPLHSQKKKQLAYQEIQNGKSIKEVCATLGISRTTMYRFLKKNPSLTTH